MKAKSLLLVLGLVAGQPVFESSASELNGESIIKIAPWVVSGLGIVFAANYLKKKAFEKHWISPTKFYTNFTPSQLALMQQSWAETAEGVISNSIIRPISNLLGSTIAVPFAYIGFNVMFGLVPELVANGLSHSFFCARSVTAKEVLVWELLTFSGWLGYKTIQARKKINRLWDLHRQIDRFVMEKKPDFSAEFAMNWVGPLPEEISQFVALRGNPAYLALHNIKLPNGFLLYGAPGNGKTMMIQKIARTLNASLLTVDASDLISSYVGGTERNIAALINRAVTVREQSGCELCVLFIDEIEGLIPHRSGSGHGLAMHDTRMTDIFLQKIEQARDNGVLIVGATNHLENVDPAARRSGRLEPIEIVFPDVHERKALIEAYYQHHFCEAINGHALEVFLKNTKDNVTSRADIAAMVRDAAMQVARLTSTGTSEEAAKVQVLNALNPDNEFALALL